MTKAYHSSESGLGTYAIDGMNGAPIPDDDMHTGNPGFHQVYTLYDEGGGIDEATGRTAEDVNSPFAESGVDVHVVSDADLFGDSSRNKSENTDTDSDPNTDPDAWMAANKHSW